MVLTHWVFVAQCQVGLTIALGEHDGVVVVEVVEVAERDVVDHAVELISTWNE